MKHISNKSFAWLSCFLLIACQPEEVTTTGSGNVLQVASVNLENEGNTRAAVTSIQEVMVYATNKTTHAAIDANSQSKFTFDGSSWSCTTPPELTDDAVNIYAWYPSKDGSDKEIAVTNNAEGNHYIPVQVESEDTFTNQKQKDYLYADQTTSGQITASSTSKSVRFNMKHALSKVSFEITKDASATETLTLTQVDIITNNSLQVGTNGQMYLKNGTLNNLSAKGQISLKGSLNLTTSLSAPNISALVAPMIQPEKVLSFRLYVLINKEERIFETGTVKTSDGVQWKAGQHNVYQIKVSKIGGTINGVAVYDWKKDSDQNTQVGI